MIGQCIHKSRMVLRNGDTIQVLLATALLQNDLAKKSGKANVPIVLVATPLIINIKRE